MTARSVKIPDMFLRGVKRKSAVLFDNTSGEGLNEVFPAPEKLMRESVETEKSITIGSSSDTSTKLATNSCSSFDKENSTDACLRTSLILLDLLRDESWRLALRSEFDKKYMRDVQGFLQKQYDQNLKIFPPREEIFTAFNLTPLSKLKVVVIGQDPYHNDGQAHGLSFSVKKGVRPPPSLKNMYKELATDIPGFVEPSHGHLVGWANQGVFMLNATLTVKAHEANSHAKIGWQTFTDQVIRIVSRTVPHCVFVLWGGFAHKKEELIDVKKHAVIKTAHPSPLSARKFFGCRCFSQVNTHLERFELETIDWNLLP